MYRLRKSLWLFSLIILLAPSPVMANEQLSDRTSEQVQQADTNHQTLLKPMIAEGVENFYPYDQLDQLYQSLLDQMQANTYLTYDDLASHLPKASVIEDFESSNYYHWIGQEQDSWQVITLAINQGRVNQVTRENRQPKMLVPFSIKGQDLSNKLANNEIDLTSLGDKWGPAETEMTFMSDSGQIQLGWVYAGEEERPAEEVVSVIVTVSEGEIHSFQILTQEELANHS
ncbi:hypothetical protein ACWOBE_03280 [Hutsoniella sourekii]